MRKIVYLFLAIIVSALIVQAQVELKVTKEITKKTGGEIEITGKSFDEVWTAATRTFMLLKFKIQESDKDSGLIVAQKKVGAIAKMSGDYSASDMPSWQISFEEVDAKQIRLFCVYTLASGQLIGAVKKPFKKFHTKLEELLED